MSDQLIVAKNLSKTYRQGTTEVCALKEVSFEVPQAACFSIAGPSGSGKSTLMNIIGAIDVPTAGELVLAQRPITALKESQRAAVRAAQIGYIFQFFCLNPVLTALQNVAMPLRILGMSRPQAYEEAKRCLGLVGLSNRCNHLPSHLSGGEMQRTAIARAVVKKPRLILADEPTGNLDSANGRQVLQLLQTVREQQQCSVIIITHDRQIASQADATMIMRDGMIEEISTNE